MKKYIPIIVSVLMVLVVVGAFVYQRGLFLASPSMEPVITSSTTADLSAESITSAKKMADLYKSSLNKVSSVPISIDTLSTNPKPLFKVSE
ncbi:MAG: hypothetical protein WC773_00540 [Patescibacteria group bacterium]|jgi:type III secretory pathway component EscU